MNSSAARFILSIIYEDEYNEKLLSIVSVWEMTIKHSIGKLSFQLPFKTFIAQQLSSNNFGSLDIKISQINIVANLPLHHRDPFDWQSIAKGIV